MARIRTIKPEFWTNERVLALRPLTRLFFIGMWNFADDYGRMLYAPTSLKARIFPMDDMLVADVREMLDELAANKLIIIYVSENQECIQITGWDHQRIDKRQESKLPAPHNAPIIVDLPQLPPTSADLPRLAPTSAPVKEGKGEECNGKKETRVTALRSDDWPDDYREQFWQAFPNKVGRQAAIRKLEAVRRQGIVTFAHLMAGLKSYKRTKPTDRPWCNPLTWLNQGRWDDVLANVGASMGIVDDPDGVLEEAVKFYATSPMRIWSKWAGPPPGEEGCRATPELLARYGLSPDGRKLQPEGQI